MNKSFGFGKKNLYLGLAFLFVVVLLSLFVFSGAREGYYDEPAITTLSASQVAVFTTSQVAALTTKHGISDGGKGGGKSS